MKIFDLENKYIHDDRMSKVKICVKLTLIYIKILVDKIKFNRDFKHVRNIIFSFFSNFVSKRINHFFIDWYCENVHWLWFKYQFDYNKNKKILTNAINLKK